MPLTLHPGRPAGPPLGSVSRFLLWQAARQPATLVGGVVFGIAWMLCQVAWPYLLGRAVDEGVTGRPADVVPWCLALLAVAGLQALATTLRHRMAVTNWLRSSLSIARLIGYHSADTGRGITATTASGEIVATVSSDALRMGEMFDVTARLSGSLVAYGVVGALLLHESRSLGMVAVVGLPVLAAVMTAFIRPLQRRQLVWRLETGRLTTLGADTVAGLRVLRGIGGEDAFLDRYAAQSQAARRAGVGVAGMQSVMDGLQVLLPGLLVAAFLWAGAQLVVRGALTAGQFVTLYGYATFLVVPLRTGVEAAQTFSRGLVAARRVLAVLRIEPAVRDPHDPVAPPPRGAELVDVASGLAIEPGRLTAVVDPDPDAAAAVAVRLGRFDDDAHRRAPVLWGGIDHTRLRVRDVRRRIVVSDTTPHLFTGPLIDGLDVLPEREPERHVSPGERQRRVERALAAAAVTETVEALPDGLAERVAERGRTFSGGQRQRLSLARALLTDAEVLVLIEPTSAVDAHTEALVADGVRQMRAGRTTVVVTESPLVLDRADVVRVLDHGHYVGSGTHGELLRRDDPVGGLYRSVVARTTSRAEPHERSSAAAGGAIDALWDTGAPRRPEAPAPSADSQGGADRPGSPAPDGPGRDCDAAADR